MNTLTQIAIWNRALGFLGGRTIAAEDENTRYLTFSAIIASKSASVPATLL